MENRTFPFFLSKKGKEKQTEEKAEKLAEKASTPCGSASCYHPPWGEIAHLPGEVGTIKITR
jgi:hypothetical protein